MLVGLEKVLAFARTYYAEHIDENIYIPANIKNLKGLPNTTGVFDPFLSSRQKNQKTNPTDGNEKPWPREADLQRFKKHMAENQHSHTILVGSSGTGKSVFIRQIVPPEYPGAFILTYQYNNFLSRLIKALPCHPDLEIEKSDIADRIVSHLKVARAYHIDIAFKPRGKHPDEELNRLVEEATVFVRKCLIDKRNLTLFVFDQIERFVADFRYAATQNQLTQRTNEIFCLIQILRALREIENVRTIFVIRKDTLFDSIDFLSYSLDAPTDSDQIFRYMYFTGITTHNGVASKQIEKSFEEIDDDRSTYKWENITAFLSLSSRSLSNTFLIQLTGYMIQHFGDTREVRNVFEPDKADTRDRRSKEGSAPTSKAPEPKDLLPVFFNQLIAGFHKDSPGTVSYDVLRLVMLTIAIVNRDTGEPISAERIAGLSHLPKIDVDVVIKYLRKIGFVITEAVDDEQAYRYAHDMLFDYIVESDSFTVRNDLQNVIERLAERRTPASLLIQVERFGRVWRDTRYYPNVGAISVALFIVYGGIVSFSSMNLEIQGFSTAPVCNGLHSIWSTFWGNWTYIDTCDSLRWYYPAIYLMDCLWVSFIYKLDRGYFSHVLRERPTLRFFATMLPVIGVFFGILMSFTPILTLVPLTIVGVIMAVLLMDIGFKGPDSIFKRTNKSWGIRTFSNMAFSLSFILLHWFMVTDNPLYSAARGGMDAWLHQYFPLVVTAKNISFSATGLFFIWFLLHIRPEQQNNVSLATRLAEFDATKKNFNGNT